VPECEIANLRFLADEFAAILAKRSLVKRVAHFGVVHASIVGARDAQF
jgi:hypothetical protein